MASMLFSGPRETLAEVDIQPGFQVLDYGCGTGIFSFKAAQGLGPEGKVYSLDIHPLALEKVPKGALKKGLQMLFKAAQVWSKMEKSLLLGFVHT
jgi:ubiquinone/menaquinone biosynthesis C-methylase UbiE